MKKLIFLAAVTMASSAFAEESLFRFGAHLSGGTFQPHEVDGPSDRGSGASFGVIGIYNLDRGTRLYSSLSQSSYKTTGTNTNIGQNAKELESSISYQYMWRVSRGFRPWIGAGVGYSKSDYTKRYVLAQGNQNSEPRLDGSKASAIGILNVNIESAIEDRSWIPGVQIQGGKAFSGKANYLRVGVYFLY